MLREEGEKKWRRNTQKKGEEDREVEDEIDPGHSHRAGIHIPMLDARIFARDY